jgi:hypothetical protein
MPLDHGGGLHDDESVTPAAPHAREPNPQQAIEGGQSRSSRRPLENVELVPQREDFQLQHGWGAATITERQQD